jgi:hypothetical protein
MADAAAKGSMGHLYAYARGPAGITTPVRIKKEATNVKQFSAQ